MPMGCCYELSMTYAPWMMIFPYPKFQMRKTDLGSISLYITFPIPFVTFGKKPPHHCPHFPWLEKYAKTELPNRKLPKNAEKKTPPTLQLFSGFSHEKIPQVGRYAQNG